MTYDSLIYFWEKRTLFIGRPEGHLKMCQGAACLTVSLEGPFLYRSDDSEDFIETRSVLTPPGVNYEVETKGQLLANCMLDPFGEDYSMLLTQTNSDNKTKNGAHFNSIQESHYREAFQTLFEEMPDYEQAFRILDQALLQGIDEHRPEHPVDSRIIAVVNELKRNVNKNTSIEDLAKVANLSVSRLVELFKQQTGIPIRRYRCWRRLFVTSVLATKTGNLTEASLAAGFTDASHFTKTFYSMVGMCPSKLLRSPTSVRLITE